LVFALDVETGHKGYVEVLIFVLKNLDDFQGGDNVALLDNREDLYFWSLFNLLCPFHQE
jgi:hypothetical protein